jgi:hypothetical protein
VRPLNLVPAAVRNFPPGAPVARSWGSEPRRRVTTLIAALALVACSGSPLGAGASASPSPGSVPTPSTPPTSSPTSTPTLIAPPTPSPDLTSPTAPGTLVPALVGTVEQAIAAVVAVAPRFAGFGPVQPGQIGDGSHVVIASVPDGWELTFVSGSGDCMAGCIEHAYAKYRVARTGEVTLLCEWSTSGSAVVEGRPC